MNSSKLRFTTGTILRMGAHGDDPHRRRRPAACGWCAGRFRESRNSVDNAADFWRLFSHFCSSVWPLTLVCLVVFYLSGFYTYGRAYQSRYKALIVAQAVTQGFLIFGFLSYLFNGGGFTLPRGALVLSWLFSVVLLVGSRIWTTLWVNDRQPRARGRQAKRQRGERRDAGDRRRRLHRLGPVAEAAGKGLPRSPARPADLRRRPDSADSSIIRVSKFAAATSATSSKWPMPCTASTRWSTWARSSATRPATWTKS